MYNLTDRHLVLAACGSIAAYKAADLASKLTQAGALVDVVMTESATRFVSPLTFQGVTGRQVYVDMFAASPGGAEVHVELGRRAEAMVVAPATATTIARIALGLAEDMVSLTAVATKAPLIICPAMDANMYENEATQANLDKLEQRGALVVGPEVGRLASGRVGPGRLAETETIIGAVRHALGRRGDLKGRKVVVSAGGTQEPLDLARYVGNYSSGKMGYAVAEAARDRGARVVLVSAPTALPRPFGVEVVPVLRAADMRDAIFSQCDDADVLVMAAAVADYQPTKVADQKIRRKKQGLVVEMVPTPDILAEVGKANRLVKVGFAAESGELSANARRKLEAKGLQLIAANDIKDPQAGFGSDMNKVVLLDRDGGLEELQLLSKYEVAQRILDRVVPLLKR